MHRMGTLPCSTSVEFLTWRDKSLCDEMLDEFGLIEQPDCTLDRIVSGRLSLDDNQETAVGRHLPASSLGVAAVMDHFNKQFSIAAPSSSGRIIAIASAHHRLIDMYLFPNGDGRFSRFMYHAVDFSVGFGGQASRSASRGLARRLTYRGEYKRMMELADSLGYGDSDGWKNLADAALNIFYRVVPKGDV